jgi:hypothetical protein
VTLLLFIIVREKNEMIKIHSPLWLLESVKFIDFNNNVIELNFLINQTQSSVTNYRGILQRHFFIVYNNMINTYIYYIVKMNY